MAYHVNKAAVLQGWLFAVVSSLLAFRNGALAISTPNVIIFYSDDQGYGDRTKYNPEILNMPNLEALAEGGIEFTDGTAGAVVCTPSRFAILTGTYAFRQRPKGGAIGAGSPPMVPGHYTIANMFKDAGYRTYMSGKWHLGMNFPWDVKTGEITGGPVDVGFDEFFGIPASMNYGYLAYIRGNRFTEPPDQYTVRCKHGDQAIISCPSGGTDCKTYGLQFPYSRKGSLSIGRSYRAHYAMSNITAEAISMIKNHVTNYPEQKFFLYLPVTAPHLPHTPHPDFVGRTSYGAYADYLEEMDYRLGQVMATLKSQGVYEDTLMIFTSDNGPEGKTKFVMTGLESTWIYKGQKRSLFEGGHRVPFIMHWPNMIPANRTWDHPVSQIDLFATFAEMIGAKTPAKSGPDSFSLWPILSNFEKTKASDVRANQPLVVEGINLEVSIRCGPLKYITTEEGDLFDLDMYPAENVFRSGESVRSLLPYFKNLYDQIVRKGHSSKTAICDQILAKFYA